MKPFEFVGILATRPRVGQNAVLGSMRHGLPGAGEYGGIRPAFPVDGVIAYSAGFEHEWEPTRVRRFVRIQRRDIIAQAVSWAMAAQNGQFVSSQEHNGTEPVYARDDVDSAIDAIRDGNRRWDHILRRETVTLELWYEDDIRDDPQSAAQRIFDSWELDLQAGPTDIIPNDSELKLEWIQRYKDGK